MSTNVAICRDLFFPNEQAVIKLLQLHSHCKFSTLRATANSLRISWADSPWKNLKSHSNYACIKKCCQA